MYRQTNDNEIVIELNHTIDNSTNTIPISKNDITHYKDIDNILEKLRKNTVNYSMYHNRRYHYYKNVLFICFRIPLILLNGINAFAAVGLQLYMGQNSISLLNAILSLFCGILSSIEILINIQKRMENELESHKNFYKLSLDLFRFLQMEEEHREMKAKDFLTSVYGKYQQLIVGGNATNIYRLGFIDELEFNDDIEEKRIQKHIDDTKKSYYCNWCL